METPKDVKLTTTLSGEQVKPVRMIDCGAEIPVQVNVLVDLATKLGVKQWPNVAGYKADKPTKKDVIGYLLNKGATEMLQQLGLMDFAERTVKMMTGENYNPGLYKTIADQPVKDETPIDVPESILNGVQSEKSES